MIDTQTCISGNPHPAVNLEKWQKMVDLMALTYGAACGSIIQLRQQEFNTVVASLNDNNNILETNTNWPWDMRSFCRHAIETKRTVYVKQADKDEEWKSAPSVIDGPVRSYFGLPIFWPDQTPFGTICIIDDKESDYSQELLKFLEHLRDLITADLNLVFNYEEMKSLALTDELTGTYNRRGFINLGEQRIKDAKRFAQSVGMIYMDIDNLKQVNDQHGHEIGDAGITTLTNLLRKNSREADLIARLGGDEFVMMQLTTNHDYLKSFCERIENEFVAITKENLKLDMLSISYGYKLFSMENSQNLNDMINQVDQLMYEHKKSKEKKQANG